jgi:N-acetylmuramoyl-L-alanine amidase
MSKKIYIDPGHSDKDPGAVGYEVERDLNEKVSKFMNEHLLANYVCETKVDPISNNSLQTVADAANAWGADLLVSNHFNAGGGDGFEALVYNEKRNELGLVFEKYVKAAGQNSRGVKYRPGLAVLRLSNMPAVLNEGAFVDNKKDIQDWNEDHELKKLGIAYAEAAAEWLDLPKKEVAPESDQSNVIYRVQVGAYREVANAEAMLKKLEKAGFYGIITKVDK